MARHFLYGIACRFLKVFGGQELEAGYEASVVVRHTGLNEAVDSARFIELDVLDLATKNFGKRLGNLYPVSMYLIQGPL